MQSLLFPVAIAAVAVLCGSVGAQTCGTTAVGHSHTPLLQYTTTFVPKKHVIVKEVVNEIPVAIPVLVPAFQYQYSPPCCTPQVHAPAQAVVQQGQGQQVVQQGHQPSGIGQLSPAQIKDIARQILAEIKREEEASGPDAGPPPIAGAEWQTQVEQEQGSGHWASPQTPPPAPAHSQGQASAPGGPQIGQTGPDDPKVLLFNHCAACHTGPSSRGRFVIYSAPGQINAAFDRGQAANSIRNGQMPHPSRPDLKMTPQQSAILANSLEGNQL